MILLDIFCAVVILAFLIRGLFKGLLGQLFWLLGVVCAGFFAFTLYRAGGGLITHYLGFSSGFANLLSFGMIFVLIFVLFTFVGKWFTKAAGALKLSAVNRVLGAAFGVIIGVLVSGMVIFAMSGVLQASYINNSILAKLAMDTAMTILGIFGS